MWFLAIWLLFAMLVGIAARSRGRSGLGWTLLAILISPLFSILLLIALPQRY